MTQLQDCNECPDVKEVEVATDLSSYCVKSSIPDGTYGLITFNSGCIVSASESPVAEYTPNECCPSGESVQVVGGVEPFPDVCNLLQKTGDEFLVKPIIENSSSVEVTGCGTVQRPWVFNATSQSATGIFASNGNDGVSVSGIGTLTDSIIVSHGETALSLTTGEHDGITVDEYGHVTAVSIDDNDITAISPVVAETSTDGTKISLVRSAAEGTHSIGGIVIVIGVGGVVQSIVGNTSTTGITDTFTTSDGRTVTVTSGLITGIA